MKLLFHPDAEREFHEGIRQYLLIDPALGADFEANERFIGGAAIRPRLLPYRTASLSRSRQ